MQCRPITRLACFRAGGQGWASRRGVWVCLPALALALALMSAPAAEAGGRKAKKMFRLARQAEVVFDYDRALDLYEQAAVEAPRDPTYQLAIRRIRFVAGQAHVDKGHRLLRQGDLDNALAEFQRAVEIDAASVIAAQERERTMRMIERRERQKDDPDAEPANISPLERERRKRDKRIAALKTIPELKPISTRPININIPDQDSKVVFQTIGKLAGINILFDSEFQDEKISLDIQNATLLEALDYTSMIAKTFWKPISHNAVFIANDNTNKRRDYQEEIVKTFYLTNAATPQEIQEVATAIRGLTDIRRLFAVNSMNALVVRGTADKLALAEKVINDVDKARPEVIIDVLVLETSKSISRELGITPVSGGTNGISLPVSYTGGGEGGTALSNLGKLSSGDWSTVLPGGQITALMNSSDTRLLQSPRIRATDNFKASLRIGDRIPIATGSFQPGIGGVGINPLVNTQFSYTDVGVNIDLTPKIHSNTEVSLHIEIEISNVRDFVDIGGISQPIIGQRLINHDVRLREGEASVLGGLIQSQTFKTRSGIPFLGNLPIIGRLFSTQDTQHTENEILVVLIPHIVRGPDIREVNMRAVASGTEQIYRVRYEQPKNDLPALPEVGVNGTEPPPAQPAESAQAAPAPGRPAAPAPGLPAAPVPTPQTAPATPAPAAPAPAQPAQPEPSTAPALSFDPSDVQVGVGESVEVRLRIRNVTQLFGSPLRFAFNPQIVRLADIVRGDFLKGDGQDLIFSKNIRNEVGQAAVNISRFPGTGGVDGEGTLVVLTLEGLAAGEASLRATPSGARNAESRRLTIAPAEVSVRVR